ncbi:1-acyl-sn-glycerol-3-phosphate acyltransferase delta-like isoform X2 [Styela clava]
MKVGPNNESPGFIASIKSNSLVHVLLAFVFVVSGLIVNILQAMTMIVWWIGNKDLYRTLNIRLAYLHWALIPFLSEWWAGVKVTLYMKPDDFRKVNKESGIVVLNHKYDMDWVVGWVVGDRVKILGNAKCMAKKALSYVPLLGWSWRFCEYIFVKRNLENDTKTILTAMETLKEFKHYYWMLIFCEGTRYTEKKYKLSMEIAEKKGLKPLKHHLLPRTRGFRMMTQGLRSSASCVYDSTIYVKDNKTPTLIDLLHGKSFDIDFLVMFSITDVFPLKKYLMMTKDVQLICMRCTIKRTVTLITVQNSMDFPLLMEGKETDCKGLPLVTVQEGLNAYGLLYHGWSLFSLHFSITFGHFLLMVLYFKLQP